VSYAPFALTFVNRCRTGHLSKVTCITDRNCRVNEQVDVSLLPVTDQLLIMYGILLTSFSFMLQQLCTVDHGIFLWPVLTSF